MTNRSPFEEAADRLDRFVADIKARQHEATGAGPQPSTPVRPPSRRHPDQDWQRNYATRTILPRGRGEFAPSGLDHDVLVLSEGLRSPDTPPANPSRPAPVRGHIGAVLGKPAKKRGVLARLFRGSDR